MSVIQQSSEFDLEKLNSLASDGIITKEILKQCKL